MAQTVKSRKRPKYNTCNGFITQLPLNAMRQNVTFNKKFWI